MRLNILTRDYSRVTPRGHAAASSFDVNSAVQQQSKLFQLRSPIQVFRCCCIHDSSACKVGASGCPSGMCTGGTGEWRVYKKRGSFRGGAPASHASAWAIPTAQEPLTGRRLVTVGRPADGGGRDYTDDLNQPL